MSERLATSHPSWLRDIDSALPVAALFVVHGNVRDRYLIPEEDDTWKPLSLHQALWQTLRCSGFVALLRHTPAGMTVIPDDEDARSHASRLGVDVSRLGQPMGPDQLAAIMRSVVAYREAHVALSVDYVSQWRPSGEPPTDAEHAVMQTGLQLVHEAQRVAVGSARPTGLFNPVFWIVDRPADLPAWLVGGTDGLRQVPVPLPDLDLRLSMSELLVPAIATKAGGSAGTDLSPFVTRLAERCEGMTLNAMVATAQLAMDQELGPEQVDDAVRRYRVGQVDNPWARHRLRSRIRDGERALTHRVRGQDRAVRHALDILIRSATGMTGAERGGAPAGPRGILFFAGPTGVGKTELAKAITDLVFGDDSAYVRFDMSEFSSEHSEARLIGSPPGYIGHGEGGELTNAVRQRPFSVVLFDEVEKAHPRILDKFLQILSDGRLTDGSGNTVYFGETLIIFTSNLGVPELEPGTLPPTGSSYVAAVRESIHHVFEVSIERPELLGRIGDNIVVFDFIDPTTARSLANGFIDNVLERAQERGLTLTISDHARHEIVDLAVADLSKGGRGVGRSIESILVNPLARAIFSVEGRTSAEISALRREAGGWHTIELT